MQNHYDHQVDLEIECARNEDKFIRKSESHSQGRQTIALKSKTLSWHMPIIGEVPISKYFLNSDSFQCFIFPRNAMGLKNSKH
jgi:hypothetical protein